MVIVCGVTSLSERHCSASAQADRSDHCLLLVLAVCPWDREARGLRVIEGPPSRTGHDKTHASNLSQLTRYVRESPQAMASRPLRLNLRPFIDVMQLLTCLQVGCFSDLGSVLNTRPSDTLLGRLMQSNDPSRGNMRMLKSD